MPHRLQPEYDGASPERRDLWHHLLRGAHKIGTFFAFLPGGKFATLHSFNGTSEGSGPSAPILASDGNFYGTTTSGGANSYGTVYKITPAGTVTTLHSFCAQPGCTDGAFPIASLVQGSDDNFYGITANDGNTPDCAKFTFNGCGPIFEISPTGQFTKLYTLCSQTNCAYGIGPLAALTQGTDGSFYGTTPYGGIFNDTCFNGCGIVFRFSTRLAAFVKPNPTFGKVGYKTNILGNNLSSTTSVTFNGVAATFSIVSDTFIKAIVPSGATTGTIQVTTPTGKHSSNVAFQGDSVTSTAQIPSRLTCITSVDEEFRLHPSTMSESVSLPAHVC